MTAYVMRPGITSPLDPEKVARGVRARILSRLIEKAGNRAQRRFHTWVVADSRDVRDARGATWALYQEAEDLLDRLYEARWGRSRW